MSTVTQSLSVEDRVAAARRGRETRLASTLVIPLPAPYGQLIAAEYRILRETEKMQATRGHDVEEGDIEETVDAAADMLLRACEDVLDIINPGDPKATPPVPPSYQSRGHTWTPAAVGRLFGVDAPEGVTARIMFRMALDGDLILDHLTAYNKRVDAILDAGEEAAQGEAEPSAEG
jgi:hypothetical protein